MKKTVNRLLEKGSQIIGIDLPYFVKGSFWLTSIQAASVLSGFLLSLVYARFLPKVIFGQYAFVFSFVAIFSGLAYPGMDTAVVRAVAQSRDQIVKQASLKVLPWVLIAALPFLGLSGYYALKPEPDFVLILAFFSCFIFSLPIWSLRFYESFLVAKNRFKLLFTISLVTNVLTALTMASVAVVFTHTLPLVIASLTLNALLAIIFSQIVFRELNLKKPQKQDFSYARSLNDIRIFNYLAVFADKIIIGKFLGFEAVAIYTFAQLFPEQIKGFLKHFYTLSLPKLSRLNLQNKKKKFYTKLGQFFVLSLFLAGAYAFLAPFIFKFVFPQYLESVTYSQVLSLSLVSLPALIITAFFESQTDTTSLRWQIYPTYSLQISLLFILTLKFGLWGTVAAVIFGRLFSLASGLFLLARKL